MKVIIQILICYALAVLTFTHAEAAATPWQDTVTIPDTPTDVLTAELTPVECLALNIYHEARGEHTLGMEIVAQVTINRTTDRVYNGSVCDVVTDIRRSKKTGKMVPMFSWTLDGKSDVAHNASAYRDAYIMAIEFLFMGRSAPVALATELIAYHNASVSPNWHTMEYVLQHNGHIVYRRRV